MKILLVTPQFPYPTWSGFTTRVYQLARQLSARHELTVLSCASVHERPGVTALAAQIPVRAVEISRPTGLGRRLDQAASLLSARPYGCREIHTHEMQRAIDELCAAEHFDVIQLESSLLCSLRYPAGVTIVIDEHNIESELLRRMSEGERSLSRRVFNRLQHRRFQAFERAAWRSASACVVTSERELPTVRAGAPATPVTAVPNAVDLAFFTPREAPPRPHSVVFNGILTYRPNVDAARHLAEDVWPRVLARYPDATLALVGRSEGVDTRALQGSGVTVCGEVPDIRPHVHDAAVVAVPVRIGGGTRLKVLEGLAMGKAIVSTSLGCEGLDVRDHEHLLIADDADAFAASIFEAFENAALRRELGEAGRRLVERRYSWELAGERLESLYRQLVDGRLATEPIARPAEIPV